MLTIPFKNDFYSYIIPSNRDELINHCVNAKKLEGNLSWGDNCLIEKENINQEGFYEILEPIINGLIKSHDTNFKGVGQPLRIALTGSKFGPGIYDIILSLGKEEVQKRLSAKIA